MAALNSVTHCEGNMIMVLHRNSFVRHSAGGLALCFAMLGSTSALAEVDGAAAVRSPTGGIDLQWTSKSPVDVYVSDRPDAPVADAKPISRVRQPGSLHVPVGVIDRPYFLIRDESDGTFVRVAESALPLGQVSNFRDLGGYAAADGRRVKWGRIFRSGATAQANEADLQMIGKLGLAEMVDLRSSEERSLGMSRVEGVRYSAISYPHMSLLAAPGARTGDEALGSLYAELPAVLAPEYRLLFDALIRNDGPVAFNCSAGQDRTGVGAALVLIALGVPEDTVLADYHLTTQYRRPKFEMPRVSEAEAAANPVAAMFAKFQDNPAAQKAHPLYDTKGKPWLQYSLDEIRRRWGSVDQYLTQELKIDGRNLSSLRAKYLE